MSSSDSNALAETLEAMFVTLSGARQDEVRRVQLAEAMGVETLVLPDWLDNAVATLRPGEQRAEQLERLLGLLDNFIDFLRSDRMTFAQPLSVPERVVEGLMRVFVPIAMETWRGRSPQLFLLAAILLFLDDRISEYREDALTYDRYVGVICDLVKAFGSTTEGEGRRSIALVNLVAALVGATSFLLKGLHVEKRWAFDFAYGLERETPPPLPEADASRRVYEAAQRSFSAWWRRLASPIEMSRYDVAPFDPRPPQPFESGFTLAPLLISEDDERIWFQSNITGEIDAQLSDKWKLRVLPGGSGGFAIPLSNSALDGTMNGKLRAELVWNGANDSDAFATAGIRASMSSFTLAAFAELGFDNADIGWGLRIERLRVTGPPPTDDGVLSVLFPGGGSFDLDLALRWTFRDGLVLERGTGLEIFDPIHKRWTHAPGGTTWAEAEITFVRLRAEVTSDNDERGIRLSATAGFALGLLGVTIVVDGFGVALSLKTDDGSGNLFRLGNLDAHLVKPEGLGARIDLGPIEGGAYFGHDPSADRYSGAIDVKLGKKWALRGFGFIEARPGGTASFVAVVNLEFDTWSPGFQIDGVGLIIATHRRGDGEALRAALDTGDLDALLFPKDPLRRVPELVASLNRFFPLDDGTHVFGIALRASYGLGLVRVRVAGLVQVGAIDKLFVVLIARLSLPDRFEDVLAIELAGVGEYTFGGGPLEIRARLRNSHIAGGELTGGAIVFWGDPGEGAGSGVWASIGGYHPRYEHVPTRVAVPERVMLAWHKGDDLEASLKMYVALTPGAFHFGAEVALRATLEGFGIKASLGIDGLIRDDWHFRIDLHGEVNILLFSRTLCGLAFHGTISGHSPICVDGSAKVSFLFWSKTFPYSKRLTDERDDPGMLADVGARLREAFAIGWSAAPDDEVVPHKRDRVAVAAVPHRSLRWQQNVLPLATPITRVGPVELGSARTFVVDQVAFGSGGAAQPVRAPFARGQFRDLGDDDQLVGPAFADEVAGIELRCPPAGGDEVAAAGGYQEIVVDRGQTKKPPPRRFPVAGALLEAGLALRTDAATWHRPRPTTVAVGTVDYRVVGTGAMGPITTYQLAREARVGHARLTRVIR